MAVNSEEVLAQFGKRAQRCYGCFMAYQLKDMYLGEDVTFLRLLQRRYDVSLRRFFQIVRFN